MDSFDTILDANLDNTINVKILSDGRLGTVELKGLIGFVSMLGESIYERVFELKLKVISKDKRLGE